MTEADCMGVNCPICSTGPFTGNPRDGFVNGKLCYGLVLTTAVSLVEIYSLLGGYME